MTAWAFQLVFAAALLSPDASTKPTTLQLKATALAAEAAGDWETAFTAYSHLYVADRTAPDVRAKLTASLRRAQQLRRHRDPAYQQFTLNTTVTDALNLFAEVMAKVPANYADRDRATPQQLWEFAVEEFERALGSPAFRAAFLNSYRPDKVDGFRKSLRQFWAKRAVASPTVARQTLRELLAAASQEFAVRHPAAIAVEFVCGACSGLDEYTVFLTPEVETRVVVADLSAHGVYLSYCDEGVFIDAVVPSSWAALHTTLRKGDRVSRVNGRVMGFGCPTATGEALRFPTNGSHELDVEDASGDAPPRQVKLPVAVPTVFGARLVNAGVGYVRVSNFAPSTPGELDAAIQNLKLQGMRALLLDLRGNHGGSFTAGVETAKRLLPGGIIVTTQGQLGEVAGRVFSSDSGMSAHDIPLVVLIDTETASAAELVAAALKDNNRATLVGMPSFGKGAVQYPVKLTALDGVDDTGKPRERSGSVRLTIAKLLSPRGVPLNGVGVTPDVIEANPQVQFDKALMRATDLLPTPMMRMTMGPGIPND
jgi:carboxyl-terminal processing protease